MKKIKALKSSVCVQCGKSFDHDPKKERKFCSTRCSFDSQKVAKGDRLEVDVAEIIRLYTVEKIGCQEIANRMEISKSVVSKRLKDSGIEMRTKSEAKSNYLLKNPDKNPFTFSEVRLKINETKKSMK